MKRAYKGKFCSRMRENPKEEPKPKVAMSCTRLVKKNNFQMKLVLPALFSFAFTSLSAQTISNPGSQFTFFTPRSRDLGNVLLNANTTAKFEFKNTGNQPLIIKSVSGSPKGLNSPNYKMILSYPQNSIRPGNMGAIEITFVAEGDTGNFKNRIMITSNATGPNYPLLYISGSIISEFEQPKPLRARESPKEFADSVVGPFVRK